MMMQSFWAILAAAAFSMMAVFVKLCSGHFSFYELVFYRSLLGVITIGFFIVSHGYSIRTKMVGGHVARSILGTLSIFLWFFTLGSMPLGTNMTLIYTTPLFMAVNFILLALMRHQKAPWGVVAAILVGFFGVTIVLQPSFDAGYLIPSLICLSVAFIDLITYWQIKELGVMKEPNWRIVFYFTLTGTVTGLISALTLGGGMTMPDTQSGLYLLGMGLCATLGQYSSTRSYANGNMLLSSCLGFSAIPISALLGWIMFSEAQGSKALLGMALIVASGVIATLYTKRTEKKRQ